MRIALCSYSQKEKETALLMRLGKVDRFDNGVFCVYAMQREFTAFDELAEYPKCS